MRLSATLLPRSSSYITLAYIAIISMMLFGCGGDETSSGGATLESVSISWAAPTTNEDGSVLTDLSAYRVYYGNTSGIYDYVVNTGLLTSCSIDSLASGMWYFAVKAVDSVGNESSFSNEVSKMIID